MEGRKRKKIRERVEALLKQNKVTAPPVPVDRIAKALGIQLRFSPLDDELSGMIYIRKEDTIIGINSLHHPNRQRFTLAHECGHFLFHRAKMADQVHVDKSFPMLMRDSVSTTGSDEMEIEANYFAAELLIPDVFIRAMVKSDLIDIDEDAAIDALAKRFKVSQSAMRLRLGNLLAWG